MRKQRIREAVIPAAGRGGRWWPAARIVPKAMLPVFDTPAIQIIANRAKEAGIKRLIIVDSPDNMGLIQAHLATTISGIKITTVYQEQPTGLGDAVNCARGEVESKYFSVMLPDDLVANSTLQDMLWLHEQYGGSMLCVSEVPPEQVSSFGIVKAESIDLGSAFQVNPINTRGFFKVLDLVEKPPPNEAPSRLGVVGRYILDQGIFSILDETPPGANEEIQLTDALRTLITRGGQCTAVLTRERLDIGTPLGCLEAAIGLALLNPESSEELRTFLRETFRIP